MKATKKNTENDFNAVEFMRRQRDKLSEKLSKMSKEEIIDYFREKRTEIDYSPRLR